MVFSLHFPGQNESEWSKTAVKPSTHRRGCHRLDPAGPGVHRRGPPGRCHRLPCVSPCVLVYAPRFARCSYMLGVGFRGFLGDNKVPGFAKGDSLFSVWIIPFWCLFLFFPGATVFCESRALPLNLPLTRKPTDGVAILQLATRNVSRGTRH